MPQRPGKKENQGQNLAVAPAANSVGELERERVALEWSRLRSERQKSALEFRLKRQELVQSTRGWKALFANPFTLAIVGGFITLMTTTISNHFTSAANIQMETVKAQLAAKSENTKADLASKAANQTLQADLIKKFVEGPNSQTVRDNLEFLIDAGLLPDYGDKVKTYLTKYPHSAPQVGGVAPPTVLGGAESRMIEWPWLVSVHSAGQFICNGTVIAPTMVLTAAQCVARGQAVNYEVVTATDDVQKGSIKVGKKIPVSKIHLHPAFSVDLSKGDLENDIAIIELVMTLAPPFSTISAQASADPRRSGTVALVAALNFELQTGKVLQGPIAIADDATCPANVAGGSALAKVICSGFEDVSLSVCPGTGSAGGPLVLLTEGGRKYQIGIVSRADTCQGRAVYGVYTRISTYVDWIRQIVPNVVTESRKEG